MEELSTQLNAILLVSLRLVPTLAFAAPFTLLRIPASVRVLIAVALGAWLTASFPELTTAKITPGADMISLAAGELAVGVSISLALQLAFAAILWAGQILDIQAGFGLAMVADPTTQAQMPLAGTILAYATAAVFFATGAHFDLLALWAATLQALPMGYGVALPDMAALGSLIGAVFAIALGLAGLVILVLFLLDMAIAFMSRTLPQMNVLLLGFQVKSMAMLLTLPLAIALSSGIFVRIISLALTRAPDLLGAP